MNKPYALLLLFACLCFQALQAQHIGLYNFEEFDLAHKAGVPGVYKMFQDTTGVIWFGSTNGIYRYDGNRVYEFSAEQKKLLGKTNYSFLQDNNGDVLIGSDYGICRYSLKHNNIKLLVHLNRVFNDRSRYYPICFDNTGALWFVASGKGIGNYKDEKVSWVQNPPEIPNGSVAKVTDVFYNPPTNEIYLANYLSTQTAVFNLGTKTFTLDKQHNTGSFVFAQNTLYRVLSNRIQSIDMATGEKHTYIAPYNAAVADNILYSRSVLLDEWIWISLRDGIIPFNTAQGLFGKPFGYEGDTKSPVLRHVSEVFKDKEGNIWICTETNGIKLLNRKHNRKFQHLKDLNSTNNIVMDITPVNDSLLLVCPLVDVPRLVNIYTNSHRALFSRSSIGNSTFSATRISNQLILLLGQSGKVYAFETSTMQLQAVATTIPSINKIIATRKPGQLIISNSHTLFLCNYRNAQLSIQKSMPFGCAAESIIYNEAANHIFCSSQESVIVFDLNTFTRKITQNPAFGSFIDYAWHKDQSLWLATRSGLQHLEASFKFIESFNTGNGLNNDVVYGIRPNSDSSMLFLSTNLGISSFSISTKKIQNFTLSDGLLESEHNGGATAADARGNYYFGNIRGITVFNESVIQSTALSPYLIVQGIFVDDSVYLSQLNPNYISNIQLYPHHKAFGINFSLLSTSEPGKLVYSYKIEGIDNNFHRSSSATAIRISKPGPGEYTIILRGEINGGKAIEKRIQLTVHAPFYLKWWFLLPAIILFHVGIFLLVRQIIRNRVRKKQQEIDSERLLYEQKSQIARELHDNVGARLSMMLNTVDWIGKKPQIEAADLSEIKENTKAVIQGLRDAIWVMDKTQITAEELFDKIKYYSHQIGRNHSAIILFNEVVHQPVILSTTQALNLFRIFQETINNALKYSEASQIDISLNYKGENGIVMSISDNGKGFDPANVVSGHGLKNMRVRANEIKAAFVLQSTINEGTAISVTLYIV